MRHPRYYNGTGHWEWVKADVTANHIAPLMQLGNNT